MPAQAPGAPWGDAWQQGLHTHLHGPRFVHVVWKVILCWRLVETQRGWCWLQHREKMMLLPPHAPLLWAAVNHCQKMFQPYQQDLQNQHWAIFRLLQRGALHVEPSHWPAVLSHLETGTAAPQDGLGHSERSQLAALLLPQRCAVRGVRLGISKGSDTQAQPHSVHSLQASHISTTTRSSGSASMFVACIMDSMNARCAGDARTATEALHKHRGKYAEHGHARVLCV